MPEARNLRGEEKRLETGNMQNHLEKKAHGLRDAGLRPCRGRGIVTTTFFAGFFFDAAFLARRRWLNCLPEAFQRGWDISKPLTKRFRAR